MSQHDTSQQLIGVVGSGQIGRDPWDPSCWSTSGYFLFQEMKKQGLLLDAFGVEVPEIRRRWMMLKEFHHSRIVWRKHFYMNAKYRTALTKQVANKLGRYSVNAPVLQIGAMYDIPSVTERRVFSYHDGNAAESLASPYSPNGLNAKRCDEVLRFEKEVYDGVDKILTMSEYLRQSFISNFDQPPEKVHCIHAGINLGHIPETIAPREWDRPRLLFIGVDFERKGGPILLSAFKVIKESFKNATLDIVGPDSLRNHMVTAGVTVHGRLRKNVARDMRVLKKLFASATLFVMPSLYEPFGIAPLEAMAHGIPAVVTNSWALAEMVTPGYNGDLAECGDTESLVDVLTRLIADPEQLEQMGLRGRSRVLEHYTWPQVVKNLQELVL